MGDPQTPTTTPTSVIPQDSLKILYLMTFGVMRLRFVKFILITIFICHSSISVVQIVDMLVTFDGNQLLQYGPLFLVSCSSLATVSSVLSAEKLLSKLFVKLAISRFRSRSRFPPEITDKILAESRRVTVWSIVVLGVLLTFSTINVPLFGDKNIYGVMLFRRSFGNVANFFCFVYYMTIPVLAYVVFINAGVIIYTLMHLRFYIFSINNHLERMSLNYDIIVDDYAKLKDEKYQKKVFEELKICIMRHQAIKMIQKKLNDKLLPYLILFLYLGVAAIIIMLFNILVDSSKFGYFVAIGSMLVSVAPPALVVQAGQALKNEIMSFVWTVSTFIVQVASNK